MASLVAASQRSVARHRRLLTQYVLIDPLTNASTAYIRPWLQVAYGTVSVSETFDFTFRVAGIQNELGSVATSLILPPVGSPAQTTRAADSLAVGGTAVTSLPSGTSATGQAGTAAASYPANVAVTGAAASGSAGTVSTFLTYSIGGVSMLGGFGTPTIEIDLTTLASVSATGSAGTAQGLNATLPPIIGVESDGAAGNFAITTVITLSSAACTGSAGSETANPTAIIAGVRSDGAAGTVAFRPRKSSVTSVTASGSTGTMLAQVAPAISGAAASGLAGGVIALFGAIIGTEIAGLAGSVSVDIDSAILSVAATGSAGTATVAFGGSTVLPSVSASGAAGTVNATQGVVGILAGAAASGQSGTVSVEIDVAVPSVAASGSAGTLSATLSIPVQGVEAVSAADTFGGTSYSLTLTGVASATAAGVAVANVAPLITGNEAQGAAGAVELSVSVMVSASGIGLAGTISVAQQVGISGASSIGQAGSEIANVVAPLTGLVAI